MAKARIYSCSISKAAAERYFEGFVDMLRYDQARVFTSSSDMIVLYSDRPPTDARWSSFGIQILASTWDYTVDPSVEAEGRERLGQYVPFSLAKRR